MTRTLFFDTRAVACKGPCMAEVHTTFSCPLCSRTIKVTKRGTVARHGHRRYTSGNTGGCATGGLQAGFEALDAATDSLTSYIETMEAKIARRANKFDESLVATARRDLAAVSQSLRALQSEVA